MCAGFWTPGNNGGLGTLSSQASKKRQGTKSREVGDRLGSERYGDLMSAPTLMVGATLPGGDRDVWTGEVGSLQWASRQTLGAHQRALGALLAVVGSREITAGIEPARRNRKVATLTVGLSHDVSTVLGIGRQLGSQRRANTSITIMRAPQRGHGQGSTCRASGVISGCFCGSAGGTISSSARAVAMFSARLALRTRSARAFFRSSSSPLGSKTVFGSAPASNWLRTASGMRGSLRRGIVGLLRSEPTAKPAGLHLNRRSSCLTIGVHPRLTRSRLRGLPQ